MTVHYHYKEQPVTIHMGNRASTDGFGFRVVTACERCRFVTDRYTLYAEIYVCDSCLTELTTILEFDNE